MQAPQVTDLEFVKLPHQSSSVGQILSVVGSLEDNRSTFCNGFPGNDFANHIQKALALFPIVLPSVLDQTNLLEKPDTSRLLKLSQSLQCFFLKKAT